MNFLKNTQILILTVVISISIFSACSRNDDKVSVPQKDDTSLLSTIEKYYKVATTKVDGTFIFESNLCNNDASLTNIVTAGGVFYNKNGSVQSNNGSVSIGNMQTTNHNGAFYIDKPASQNGLYGTDVTFTIKSKPSCAGCGVNGTVDPATATIYSPLAISITNIPPRTPVSLTSNTSTTLTWNADAKNPNGVVIMAEYIPSRSPNREVASAGADKLVQNSQLVPDNGSTSIPWSFFSGFPVGGHIILWVARGNYTIASDGVYNYTVGGYTAASVWDVLIPAPPPNITIMATNNSSFSSTATYTNQSTGAVSNFAVPVKGGTIGVLPAGSYSVTFKSSIPKATYVYGVCNQTSSRAATATFSNVSLSSSCNTISVNN